jgi:hypothetical protein
MKRRSPLYPRRDQVATIEHAWCSACDWTATGPTSRKAAADHVRWHRHRVRTTKTVVAEYNPRSREDRAARGAGRKSGAHGQTTAQSSDPPSDEALQRCNGREGRFA